MYYVIYILRVKVTDKLNREGGSLDEGTYKRTIASVFHN